MSATLRAEFLKLRTTRTAAGLAGLALAVTALIGTLESATAGTGRGMAIPSLATPAGLRDALASTGFALIAAAELGAVTTAGEFRHETATGTFLDQPSRARVLAATAAAATGIGLGFAAARKEADRGRDEVAVAADDRAHLAGHLGELPGPSAGIGRGISSSASAWSTAIICGVVIVGITSRPRCTRRACAGIEQADERVRVPPNRSDG
jgi:hypothetical protein